jgi:UDP-glucose 4-epimerase
MKIAVTGAMGLIGAAVVAAIGARGHDAIRIGRGAGNDVIADLGDSQLPVLPACDALIHCAGVTDEEVKADPAAALVRAAIGTDRLIAAAVAAGAGRMAYVSSAHVYGPLNGHIDETLPANPLSDYGLAHYLAEQMFRRNVGRYGLAVQALRPCAVYGPLADPKRFRRWSLIPFAFPKAIAVNGIIRISGTGRDRRNFVGSDVVAMLAVDFIVAGTSGVSVLNPIGAAEMTVAEFAELCARLGREQLNRSCRVEIAGAGPESGAPLEYRSVAGGTRSGQTLEAHVAALVRHCSQVGANA